MLIPAVAITTLWALKSQGLSKKRIRVLLVKLLSPAKETA